MEKVDLLQNNFGLLRRRQTEKDFISFKELLEIISNLKLNDQISEEEALRIFKEIDFNNNGKILKGTFLTYIQKSANDEYALLYRELCDSYTTKSEIIIEKLICILNYFKSRGDNHFSEEVEWIIDTIANDNIFEPTINLVSVNKTEESLLSLVTSIDSIKNHKNDLEQVALSDHKYKTSTFFSINNFPHIKQKEVPFFLSDNIKRPNIDLLSLDVSKSLNLLSDVNNFTFDVFDLSDKVGLDTIKLLTAEIFTKKDYFNRLIKKSTFNHFIKEVSVGYYRTNPYHNDIHSADVLQTVFVMLSQGLLEEV